MADSGIWRLGLALMGGPSVAWAQAEAPRPAVVAPAAKPAPPGKPAPAASMPKAVQEVVVNGAAPDAQSAIDKHSFTLGKDLLATTGSIGDALRNVPSVEVDLQGNLSLRGDPNVTILVDGKPSPMFEGAGRADALQQLPADQIERVEVITNPSAAINPEGSGGVINLITKTGRGGGVTGSAYVTAGSGGLKRAGVNLGYNSKTLSVTGALSGNYQRNKAPRTDLRGGLDPATGRVQNSQNNGYGRNLARGPTGRLNLTYTATPQDTLTAGATYNELLLYGSPFDHYEDDDPAGAPVSVLDRTTHRRLLITGVSLTSGWRHSLGGDGHELSADLLYNTELQRDQSLHTDILARPPTATPLEFVRDDGSQHHGELKLAYSRPLAGGALKAGYELKADNNAFDYEDFQGAAVGALTHLPGLANHFRYRQALNAAYATYQHAFGDLDVQGGLRVEAVNLSLTQETSGQTGEQDYVKAYPSLHLAYKLDDERKLTASYSQRVQRPFAVLLNPLRYAISSKDVQQGNPDLQPQDTQSFELGYEQRQGPSFYQATLYYRRNVGAFSQLLFDLGNGVFEYSWGNLGSSRAAGLELTATGKLGPNLSYNASSNLYWNEIDAGNLGVAGVQSAYGIGGRANLDWKVRPDDLLQLNAVVYGKRLLAQGVNRPTYTVNLGWRHKVSDRVTATLTIQDLLATSGYDRRLNTPTLTERFKVEPVARAIFLRLDYRFGGASGKPAKDPGFEYDNPSPTPG